MSGGKKSRERSSGNDWMITFSDLVTLLLTFFVLLFSMSSMDDQKLKIAFQNFGGSSGLLSFREYRQIASPMDVLIEGLHQSLGERVVMSNQVNPDEADRDIRELTAFGNSLVIHPLRDGLRMVFGSGFLFPEGGADISEEEIPTLGKIARFIARTGYQVYIDGHTDNTPTDPSRYPSNEDLSIARALAIRNHLLMLDHVSPERISLAGYGDMKPIASNDLAGGREKNRRVEVILKNQSYF